MTEEPTQLERLRARSLPTRKVHLPRDPVAYAAAVDELATAVLVHQQAGRGEPTRAATERVLAARAALDEVAADVETFVLRCLPPPEWEALRALHPPTPEQLASGLDWDPSTLRPALLAEVVVPQRGEAPYTAEQWAEFAQDGRVSVGEQDLLVDTAVLLNTRAVQVAPGKG